MHAAIDLFNRVAIGWWNYVFHACWQAAVVGLAILLLVHFLGQRWPAPLRYAFLVLALLKFACPPLLPVPTGVFTHFTPPRVMLPSEQERKPAQASRSQELGPGPAKPTLAEPVSAALLRELRLVHWCGWLMLAHAAGTTTMVLLIRRQVASVRALVRTSSRLFGGFLGELYRDLALLFSVPRIPRLAVSGHVDGPIAFGVKEPSIMLPQRIVHRLEPAELKAILAHELAHCERGDLWLTWVQLSLLALWWFHPVFWLVNRSLREAREDCCDDLLLARGVMSNDAYCDVLLRTASELCPPPSFAGSLGFGDAVHPLGRRLARITDWTLRRAEGVSRTGGVLVLLGALLLLPGTQSEPATPGARPDSSNRVLPPAPPRVSATQSLPAVAARLSQPNSNAPDRPPVSAPSLWTVRAEAGRSAARFNASGLAPGVAPGRVSRTSPAIPVPPVLPVPDASGGGTSGGRSLGPRVGGSRMIMPAWTSLPRTRVYIRVQPSPAWRAILRNVPSAAAPSSVIRSPLMKDAAGVGAQARPSIGNLSSRS